VTVRFATFNVENLFARPKAFNLTTRAKRQPVLDAFAEFNALIARQPPAGSVAHRRPMGSTSG
jgi:hypothetical protein